MDLRNNNDDEKRNNNIHGFEKRLIHFYDFKRKSIDHIYIWLPDNSRMEALIKERADKAELNHAAEEISQRENDRVDFLKISRSNPDDEIVNDVPAKSVKIPEKKKAQRLDQFDYDAEKIALEKKFQTDLVTAKENFMIQIYDWDEPLKIINNAQAKLVDPEAKKRSLELYNLLMEKGCFRRLAGMESGVDRVAALNALYDSHPNFREVIDFVREQVTLCAAQGKPPHFPPCLIYGTPGIGKTDFSHTLSKVIGTLVIRIGFDSGLTDSKFTGSDTHWGNSTTGILFDTIAVDDLANPFFLLDEIDKTDQGKRDPLCALHTILEPVTNEKVTDISVRLDINTSYSMWIATANDPGRISSPLRSRFREFHVDHPKGADALKLAQTMAQKTHAELGLSDFEPVDRQIVKLLAHLTAREQSQALKQAFARAVSNGRKSITKADLPPDVFLDQDDEPPLTSSRLH